MFHIPPFTRQPLQERHYSQEHSSNDLILFLTLESAGFSDLFILYSR